MACPRCPAIEPPRCKRYVTCVLNKGAIHDSGCPAFVSDDAPRPFEKRCDRPFTNLSEVHHAGKAGLDRAFPVGSLWDYGPFVEGQKPTVVRVIPRPEGGAAYTSGENYSKRPEDSCALSNPTWFIACEVVYDPFAARRRLPDGFPPHTLVPHVGCGTCFACSESRPCYNCTAGVLQSQRAEIEGLREDLDKATKRGDELAAELRIVSDRNGELHRAVAQARKALA